MCDTITLFRPVDVSELAFIETSGWKIFPAYLNQFKKRKIIYFALYQSYAEKIAREWIVTQSGSGFVVMFDIRADYIKCYPVKTVGGVTHKEYWIPAEDMDNVNQCIVGELRVVAQFHKRPHWQQSKKSGDNFSLELSNTQMDRIISSGSWG